MSDGPMLAIEDVVIDATGELDFGASPEMLEVAEPLAAAGRSLVLDLTDVTFATPMRSVRWPLPDICADGTDSRGEGEAP